MDNKKVKAAFGGKPKMLGLDEVADITGHEVGGVCPFGLKTPLPVYCDVSLKAFDVVVPAAGSTHSAVRITPDRMAELTSAEWVDVCEVRAEGIVLIIVWRMAATRAHRGLLRCARLLLHLRMRRRASLGLRLLCAGVGLEYGATAAGELRRVLPQARDNPVGIGNLVAAQPPHIRRARHLLFPCSAIFLRQRGRRSAKAADRDR